MRPYRASIAFLAIALTVSAWLSGVELSGAQTYSSGSTGADGVFNPPGSVPPGTTTSGSTVTVPLPASGLFNFQTVTIGSGITVSFTKNARNTPVTILATGNITIAGTLSVNGRDGQAQQASSTAISVGGDGGPGGYRGGNGSKLDGSVPAAAGQGPGGGAAAPPTLNAAGSFGTYGTSSGSLNPLFGGSGGGGGYTSTAFGVPTFSGGGGGGGGGAIVIASSTRITVNGALTADGGSAGACGGSGSGGAVRLVAPVIAGAGTISAVSPPSCAQTQASGRIRLEAYTNAYTGNASPFFFTSAPAPGPVTATGNPALINLPTLTISSVGGISTPAAPSGSYASADMTLPTGTTNPVPVVLTAVNTPLNTAVTLKLVPVAGIPTTFPISALSGTFASSTGSANVTFPTGGQVSVLNAYAEMTLTAGLFPSIDGEDVDRVLMAAAMGGPSSTTLVMKSGRAVPLSALSEEDQLNVAMAFEAMRASEQ
jgi:hypothetical protein